MKKIALMLTVAAVLFAAESANLKKDMAAQEAAMATIQKGMLYSSPSTIEEGLKALKAANQVATLKDSLPHYLPEGKGALAKVAMRAGERVNLHADRLAAALAKKEYTKLFAEYGEILNACNSCHIAVRQWK
ncbi:MAG: hypothetical protein K6347_02780 [Campylobacterales bacterium]